MSIAVVSETVIANPVAHAGSQPDPRTGVGTLAQRVRVALEEGILSGALQPGERLDEAGLASRYGASRTPVREALRQLAASGLVEIRAHQGAVVAQPTTQDLIEMFEVMAELEASCSSLAARRATSLDRADIMAAHNACIAAAAAVDESAFYEANNLFHEAIYRAAHNRFLLDQTLALRNRLGPWRRFVTFHPGRMSASIEEHARIMDLVFAMNGAAAADFMRTHVDNLRDGIAALISQRRVQPDR
jgi:DNA-binding GntR family transcriptional regulator